MEKYFSMVIKNETQILVLAGHLNALSQQNYQIVVSFNGKIYNFGYVRGLEIKGSTFFLMPLIISTLIIFNTILGSIYERKREISILSLVGLSPIEISVMFIAKTTEYAILSVVIGIMWGFILYAFPFISWHIAGVPYSFLPVTWVDMGNFIEQFMPGAIFGIATDFTLYFSGFSCQQV